jgi:hypothetical protein
MAKTLIIQRIPTRAPTSRIEWDVTVDPDTKIDDLLEPGFWAHVAGATFNGSNNLVNVYWEDKSQIAFLYVRYYDSVSAKMELLDHKVFGSKVELTAPDKYEVKWTGPNTKHRVVRLSDGQTLKENISSKEDAALFIKEYESRNK